MATIWDETKKQTAKMKGRPFKEVIGYIWEYYKIHIGLTVLALGFIIAIIHTVATSKDIGVGIVLLNAVSPDYSEEYTDWKSDLTDILDLNEKKYEVSVEASMTIGLDSDTANAEYTSEQKFAALMSSKSIDVMAANSSEFEHYAQLECFYDLSQILPADMFEKYSEEGLIYYTDASTFSDYDDDSNLDVDEDHAAMTIDHTDPASMEDPVAVGIIVSDSPKLVQKQVYSWILGSDDYQGQPQEAVLGIPGNSERIDAAVKTIEYLMD